MCVLLNDDIPPGIHTPGALWQAVRGLGLTIQVIPMRRSVFGASHGDVNAFAHDIAQDGVAPFQDGVALFDAAIRPQ